MSTQVQWKRGTTAQNNTYTGAVAEITVDTTLKQIRLHDGVTQGGTIISGNTALAVNSATNIANGLAGQILYQVTGSQTGFITPGPNGSFLISNGSTSTFGNTITNLTVSGQSIFQGVTATLFTATTVTVNGNETVGGTLNVTGQTTLAGLTATNITGTSLTISGNAVINGTIYGTVNGSITTASNLAQGGPGMIPYQSNTGTTSFISTGTLGQLLQSNGAFAAPSFINTSSLLVGLATNLLGGSAGQLHYQSGANTSAFTGNLSYSASGTASYTAATGQTLVVSSNGLGVTGNSYFANNLGIGGSAYITGDLYVDGTQFIVNTTQIATGDKFLVLSTGTTSTALAINSGLYIGPTTGTAYASWTFDGSANWVTGGSAGTGLKVTSVTSVATTNSGALQVSGGLGVGLGGFFGGTVTATTFVGNLTGNVTGNLTGNATLATTATNLANGAAGSIPYQTASSATTFLAIGTAGYVLTVNAGATAPQWTSIGGLSAGTATNANNVLTVQQPVAGTYYPTFVSANNVTAAYQAEYTTSSFSLDASTGIVTLTGKLNVNNNSVSTATASANAIYTAGGIYATAGLTVAGPTLFKDTVTFSGTATYVYSTNTVYTDNIIEVHTPPTGVNTNWNFDDGKDIGFRFHYYTASTDTNAALVLANDTKYLEWYNTGAESTTSNFTSATYGTFKTGQIILTSATNAISTLTGALVVSGGVGIGGGLYVGAGGLNVSGASTFTNIVVHSNVTPTNSTTTGALQVAGGVGIGLGLFVGGVITATNLTLNTSQIRLGSGAGQTSQSLNTVAIGNNAGLNTQGNGIGQSVAVGYGAGQTVQGAYTVAVGANAGNGFQGAGSVAVGYQSAYNGTSPQGSYAVAIGYQAGYYAQTTGSIIISAGLTDYLGTATNAGLYINPVRGDASTSATQYAVYYNIATKELTTATAASGSSTGTTSTFVITNSTPTSSTATGALVVYGGVGIWGGTVHGGITTVTNVTAASSTNTGAFQVSGGAGIGGNLYVGGSLYTNGSQVTPTSIQEFTATAGQTTFTIAGGYTVGQIQVFANGIQLGTGDYTASNGTTVVLNIGRNVSDIVRVVVSQNYVISAQQAYTFNQYTATGGQTTFTTAYNTSTVQVFANGALVSPTAYTANNGTSIIFGSGRTAGDIIAVISFNSVSIANAISSSGGTINGTLNVNGSLQQNGVDVAAQSIALSIAMSV